MALPILDPGMSDDELDGTREFAGDDDFLLVTTREAAGMGGGNGRTYVEFLNQLVGLFFDGGFVSYDTACKRGLIVGI